MPQRRGQIYTEYARAKGPAERGMAAEPAFDERMLRHQAFTLTDPALPAGRRATEAETTYRYLRYGPEQPADPAVEAIVATALSDFRGLRFQVNELLRTNRD